MDINGSLKRDSTVCFKIYKVENNLKHSFCFLQLISSSLCNTSCLGSYWINQYRTLDFSNSCGSVCFELETLEIRRYKLGIGCFLFRDFGSKSFFFQFTGLASDSWEFSAGAQGRSASVYYYIWGERNNRIFQGQVSNKNSVANVQRDIRAIFVDLNIRACVVSWKKLLHSDSVKKVMVGILSAGEATSSTGINDLDLMNLVPKARLTP